MYDPRIFLEPTIHLSQPWMWGLVVVALGGAFALTRQRPDYGLALIIAALPLYQIRGAIGAIPTTFLELLLLTVVVAVASRWRDYQWRVGWLGWSVLAWTAAALVAALVGPDLREGLGLWRAFFFEPALWLLAALAVFRGRDPRPLLWGAIGLIGTLALWSAYLLFDGRAVTNDDRLLGPFQTPNYFSLILVPTLLLLITWPRREAWLARLPVVAAGVGMLAAANSRGGQLALAAGLITALAFLKGTMLKRGLLALVVVAIVAVALLGPRLFVHSEGQVLQSRPVIWQQAVEIIKDDPWFGNGPGQFQDVFAERIKGNRDHELYVLPQALNPHNLVLVTWAEWGLLTLLALLAVLVGFARTVWQRRSYWQMVPISMLAAIIVHGVVDTPVLKNDLALLFMVALLLVAVVPTAKSWRFDGGS